ncbi:hypothetical protein AB0J83_31750 [Actinoplanes sp. NPDC049596]|uniref:hypothetical protein n=1 Tax=unclassified Actinoplanes TaxID=2626549 RepID=UPI00343C9142
MTEPRWLTEQEDKAWRGLMAMEDSLTAFIDRRLRTGCGLSHADYQVLAQLIAAAARQHVADARDAVIDQLTATELKTLATITDKVRRRLAALDPAARP